VALNSRTLKALLISYNDEGVISAEKWKKMLEPYTIKSKKSTNGWWIATANRVRSCTSSRNDLREEWCIKKK